LNRVTVPSGETQAPALALAESQLVNFGCWFHVQVEARLDERALGSRQDGRPIRRAADQSLIGAVRPDAPLRDQEAPGVKVSWPSEATGGGTGSVGGAGTGCGLGGCGIEPKSIQSFFQVRSGLFSWMRHPSPRSVHGMGSAAALFGGQT
jgi:hypothetical protein